MFSLMDSALDAVGASDDMLDEATLAIKEADLHRRAGRVVDLIGLITEATASRPRPVRSARSRPGARTCPPGSWASAADARC